MKIPRLSMVTLGVADLGRATAFYESVLATPPTTSYDGVTFIELPGTWLALYPLALLAQDSASDLPVNAGGFGGITLAHNARDPDEVRAIMDRAQAAGGRIVKPPQETGWGGFSGYFADPDGTYWEVAWGPMFAFTDTGALRFKDNTVPI
jgi:uncharacterized protein